MKPKYDFKFMDHKASLMCFYGINREKSLKAPSHDIHQASKKVSFVYFQCDLQQIINTYLSFMFLKCPHDLTPYLTSDLPLKPAMTILGCDRKNGLMVKYPDICNINRYNIDNLTHKSPISTLSFCARGSYCVIVSNINMMNTFFIIFFSFFFPATVSKQCPVIHATFERCQYFGRSLSGFTSALRICEQVQGGYREEDLLFCIKS